MKNSAFRKSLAKFIRGRRSYKSCFSPYKGYSRSEIKLMIVAFCNGWSAFGDEIDRIGEKYFNEAK